MNWTTMQGNWNETKGKVKTKWGRLTDDDLMQVEGHKDRLVGVIQQKYGIAREKAEQQLEEFMSSSDGLIAKAKEGVAEVVEKGKEYVEKGKEAVVKGKEYVQNTSASQMASDLKDLIARHPVHSAIIGIGLGFLIGRMMTSSNRS
jgi:uncharacterized protein YjbJ (UPF0337 family)